MRVAPGLSHTTQYCCIVGNEDCVNFATFKDAFFSHFCALVHDCLEAAKLTLTSSQTHSRRPDCTADMHPHFYNNNRTRSHNIPNRTTLTSNSLTHSLIQLFTHSLTHSPTHSLARSLIQLFTHSLNHLYTFTQPPTHSPCLCSFPSDDETLPLGDAGIEQGYGP